MHKPPASPRQGAVRINGLMQSERRGLRGRQRPIGSGSLSSSPLSSLRLLRVIGDDRLLGVPAQALRVPNQRVPAQVMTCGSSVKLTSVICSGFKLKVFLITVIRLSIILIAGVFLGVWSWGLLTNPGAEGRRSQDRVMTLGWLSSEQEQMRAVGTWIETVGRRPAWD